MRKYNIGISVLLCCLSGAIFYWSEAFKNEGNSTDQLGPAFWPRTLAVVFIILAAVLAVQTAFRWKALADRPIDFKSPGLRRVYLMCAILLVFCVLLKLIGFYVAAVFMIPACMFVLGEKRPQYLAAITVGILAAVYVIFGLLLNLPMPSAF